MTCRHAPAAPAWPAVAATLLTAALLHKDQTAVCSWSRNGGCHACLRHTELCCPPHPPPLWPRPDLPLASRDCLQTTLCCWVQPELNQIEFHPYLQQPELAAFCKEHGIVLETYSPLMSLTNKRGELAANRGSRTAGHLGPDVWAALWAVCGSLPWPQCLSTPKPPSASGCHPGLSVHQQDDAWCHGLQGCAPGRMLPNSHTCARCRRLPAC